MLKFSKISKKLVAIMTLIAPKNESNKMHNCTKRGGCAVVSCSYASYLINFLVRLAYIIQAHSSYSYSCRTNERYRPYNVSVPVKYRRFYISIFNLRFLSARKRAKYEKEKWLCSWGVELLDLHSSLAPIHLSTIKWRRCLCRFKQLVSCEWIMNKNHERNKL